MIDSPCPVLTIAHADWSISPKKRWVTCAQRADASSPWTLALPSRLDALLGKGTPTHHVITHLHSPHGHTLLGLDLPLGVPRLIAKPAGVESFCALLTYLIDGDPTWRDFLDPCITPTQISPHRPFYPHSPKGSRRAHLIDGLEAQSWSDLLRQCDAPEPGGAKPCPLFWCVGANQVGKAAITAWRELLMPLLDEDHVRMWPFDGRLDALVHSAEPRAILAEVYPAEIYRWLAFDWGQHGKRSQQGRRAQSRAIIDALDALDVHRSPALRHLIEDGFGEGAAGEDPFDSLVGVVGMLQILGAERPLFEPEDLTTRAVEGWILGRHDPDHRTPP